jgi:hypothetical protein
VISYSSVSGQEVRLHHDLIRWQIVFRELSRRERSQGDVDVDHLAPGARLTV